MSRHQEFSVLVHQATGDAAIVENATGKIVAGWPRETLEVDAAEKLAKHMNVRRLNQDGERIPFGSCM